MWMGPGSYWSQPAGETHITSAKGSPTTAFLEILDGPYLVRAANEAFDSGERPVNVDPSNRFALSADLGIDQVLVYRLEPSTGKLTPNGAEQVAPGSGPRHLAFHPEGAWTYVLNELNRTVTAFTFR